MTIQGRKSVRETFATMVAPYYSGVYAVYPFLAVGLQGYSPVVSVFAAGSWRPAAVGVTPNPPLSKVILSVYHHVLYDDDDATQQQASMDYLDQMEAELLQAVGANSIYPAVWRNLHQADEFSTVTLVVEGGYKYLVESFLFQAEVDDGA